VGFVVPIISSIGGAIGGIGSAIGGAVGGLGGFASTLSTLGSIASTLSSFMGQESPDVPTQQPINMAPAEALPEVTRPATVLTSEDQASLQSAEKKRRLLAASRTNDQNQAKAPGSTLVPAEVQRPTLLGA